MENLCKTTFHYVGFLCRQDFERGGFVPDIVGRLVSLNLDKKAMEGKDVAVLELEEEESEYIQFPTDDYDADEDCHGFDFHNALVSWASSFDSEMQTLSADNVLELSLIWPCTGGEAGPC